jgi:hypothetical protein
MSLLADIYISRDNEAVSYDTTPDQFADRANRFGPVFDIGSVVYDLVIWGAVGYFVVRGDNVRVGTGP